MKIWRATTKINANGNETQSHRDYSGNTTSEASGHAIKHAHHTKQHLGSIATTYVEEIK